MRAAMKATWRRSPWDSASEASSASARTAPSRTACAFFSASKSLSRLSLRSPELTFDLQCGWRGSGGRWGGARRDEGDEDHDDEHHGRGRYSEAMAGEPKRARATARVSCGRADV